MLNMRALAVLVIVFGLGVGTGWLTTAPHAHPPAPVVSIDAGAVAPVVSADAGALK